jgi:hypothetical protein
LESSAGILEDFRKGLQKIECIEDLKVGWERDFGGSFNKIKSSTMKTSG